MVSEEQYKKKLNYNNQYNKKNYRSFSVRFSVKTESDIINWLSSKPQLKTYLLNLIHEDMNRSNKKG